MDKPFPAYRGDGSFVFVCYAHEDADIVYPELAWLNAQGVEFWYDEGISAGANWRATIGDSIFNAARVLFYVSRASLRSDHCNREINLALDEGKELVPVYLEDVELTSDLKVGLNRVQALHRERDRNYRQNILSALGGSGDSVGLLRESTLARLARRRVRLTTAVTLAAMAVLMTLAVALLSSSGSEETDRTVRRFLLNLDTTGYLMGPWPELLAEAAIAPDGSRIAYISAETGDKRTMYIRALDQMEPTRIEADWALSPSFSPDGEWVVYYTFFEGSGWLAKLSVATGRSERLVSARKG